MKRAGYEADRQVLMLRDLATGKVRALTEGWDRSVGSIAWAPDSKTLFVTAEDTQEVPLWSVDAASGKVTRLTGEGSRRRRGRRPRRRRVRDEQPDRARRFLPARGQEKPSRLTSVNADKLAGIDMPTVTRFSFTGANGDTVWGYAVKPAGLADGAKVPVAFMVHGGPQGSSNNSWSYRWNPAVFAGAGYGAGRGRFPRFDRLRPGASPTRSAAIGAAGRSRTCKSGLKAATDKFGWLDGDNACALGASYGGYMMNWIEGQWPDRFKCIVQHDGVFDARAMAYETEELWFDEWEHGGHPYYEDAAGVREMEPGQPRRQLEDADAGHHRREGFPHSLHPGPRRLSPRSSAASIPSRLLVFPDEKPLGAQAEEEPAMVWRGARLDGEVDG